MGPGYRRQRLDYDSMNGWQRDSGDAGKGERHAANCDTAAERARAYAESSRRNAETMTRAVSYWSTSGNRPDISGVYALQGELYRQIAELYGHLEANAQMLAGLFRGES